MINATMRGFKVSKFEFSNKIKEQKKIELNFGCSYNVRYSQDNTCVGEITTTVTDKNDPDEFKIKIVANGIFTFRPGTEKEILHIETYNDLFPYIRTYITTMTANAGIPPIITPYIDISKKEIYRFDMGKDGRPRSADDFINPYDENNN